jgi:hypothetical protein
LTAQAVTAPTPAPAALDTAGIANAFAAAAPTLKPSDTAVFHGLFCRRQPPRAAARVVNALWRVPNAEPSTGATATRTPVANGVLDLFKDTPVKGS